VKDKSCLVVFSGGMDSATLLLKACQEFERVEAISFNYNQRHRKELQYAVGFCEEYCIPHQIVALPAELFVGSSQTSQNIAVPHGHYTEESMKVTVVPNRNMVMLSFAVAHAVDALDEVWMGMHAGDHAIYPDCRPPFVTAMGWAIEVATENKVCFWAPFITKTKREIALIGQALQVPWNLTWSCYEGGDIHCGLCGTCVERKEALSGFDPTIYKD
jgi:7-cyano-7-deazaguanine synthase